MESQAGMKNNAMPQTPRNARVTKILTSFSFSLLFGPALVRVDHGCSTWLLVQRSPPGFVEIGCREH